MGIPCSALEGRSTLECADHLEYNYGAHADLTDVIVSEEGLGRVEQFRRPLREIIRDEHLERVHKLDSDRRPGRCSREKEDVALQSRAVSRQNRLVIGPCTHRFCAIGQCEAIFDPYGNSLASSTARK